MAFMGAGEAVLMPNAGGLSESFGFRLRQKCLAHSLALKAGNT